MISLFRTKQNPEGTPMGLTAGAWLEDAIRNGLIDPRQLAEASLSAPATTSSPKHASAKKPAPIETAAPRRMRIEFDIPARATSEANAGGSLKGKLARKSALKAIARSCLPRLTGPFPVPCRVTITRHGTKKLDDDNLGRSLKSIRDVIADWLGVDDGDEGPRGKVRWRCRQAAAWTPFVRVIVELLG
jgi:hypothetical protein